MSDDSSPDKSEDEDLAIDNDDHTTELSKSEKPARFDTSGGLQTLDFEFTAYDQDICILGSKGSGKSYLANQIMKGLNGISVWCYDFNFQFFDSHAVVIHTLEDLFSLYEQQKSFRTLDNKGLVLIILEYRFIRCDLLVGIVSGKIEVGLVLIHLIFLVSLNRP